MKLAANHYLSVLRERDELEVLLRNLLVVEGYSVIKKASRGKREFGVDVAAYKRQGDDYHLYLFQVKAGDLDRSAWNDGVNSVRTGLTEAIDKPFNAYASISAPPVKRHLVIVYNGYIKDDVVDLFNGFIEDETRTRPSIQISEWNQSTLVAKVEASLVNEGLVPGVDALALKKILAFADVPHYHFGELKAILRKLTDAATSPDAAKVRRLFSTARVITRMTAEYARRGGAFANAVIASETAILHLSHWCQTTSTLTPTVRDMLHMFLEDYAVDLGKLMDRLEPSIAREHGLSIGGSSEQLEYPLRTFEILSFAAIHALLLAHLGHDGQEHAALRVDQIVVNNPSSHRPLLDNHGVSICLVALVYAYLLEPRGAAHYAIRVLDNLTIRTRLRRPLPELYNNLHAVTESIATGKRPVTYVDNSSTILPMLFEFLLLATEEEGEEAYNNYRESFDGIDLQQWYPPEDYAAVIFSEELQGGVTETSIPLPESFGAYRSEAGARHARFSQGWPTDSFSARVNGFVVLIAFRHFRTPVFPHLWRQFIQYRKPDDDAGAA